MRKVAILCCDRKTIYSQLVGLELYDRDRDAKTFDLAIPAVAHPPCAQWSRLRAFARSDLAEKELAFFCLEAVRLVGGVLEHPAGSAFWDAAELPPPGGRDRHGLTVAVDQHWWGHSARKRTLLYVVGSSPRDWPDYGLALGSPPSSVAQTHSAYRSRTPLAFATWLVAIARAAHFST